MFSKLRAHAGFSRIRIAFAVVAALTFFPVDLAAQASPSVTVTPTTVAPGGVITATIANGPGNATDWVAVAATSAPDVSYLYWKYLNGSTVPPGTGLTNATVQLVVPLTPGTYEVRFFANNGFTRLATSSAVTVQATPTLTINTASVAEGNSGTAPATFTVTLSPTSSSTVTVRYATANGTATAGSDYVAASGTLKFVPGVTTRTLRVSVRGDTTVEPNETFVVTLSSPTKAVLGSSQGGGTIVNDDAPPANDTTPPLLTSVTTSSITASGGMITWTTNEGSDSQVDYGLTTAYGSASALNSNLVTAHAATLTGLASATLYHFRVRSRDAAGNLATSADFTFTTLDGTAPSVSIMAPASNATVSGPIALSATAADNIGVAGVQFRLDGAPLGAEDVASPYSMSWNTSGSADLVFGVTKVIVGPMTMTAGSGFTKRLSVSCPSCTGEDMVTEDMIQTSAGQTAATWTFSIAAHYLAQMAAFKAAGTPAYVQGATATSNSAGTTIAQTFGTNVATGNLLVAAVAWQGTSTPSVTDSRGNTYSVATQAYDSLNGQSLAILYAPNVNGGATTVTANFTGTTPTVRRLELHEYSGIATTSPLDVTATNSADGVTTVNTITSGSAMTNVTAPVPNGSHTLTARARDAAGNTTTSAAVTVTVNNGGDTTPPVISGINVSAITSSAATFTWTTNEASDSEVEYGATTAYGGFSTLDVNRVTAHTMGLSGLAPSTLYHYRVRSRDGAGNLGLSSDFTFTTLEGAPPTVAITAPLAGAIVSGTIMVTANANDNVGVAGVQFQVDGAPLGAEDTIAPYGVAWDTTTAAPGLPVLTAVARDAAGNRTTSSPVAVTVASVSAEVELAWDANTEPDIAGYRVYFGTSSGSYSVNLDVGNVTDFVVTGLQTGTLYYFAVTAYNSSGFESGVSNQVSATR